MLGLGASACAPVAASHRGYLADPTMQLAGDALEASAKRRKHAAREGANGGDGLSAGGGCGCAN